MKKVATFVLAIVAAGSVLAAMDDWSISQSLITSAASTNSITVRGEIPAIYAVIPATKTATVAIVSAEGTVFSKSMTAATDGVFYPRTTVVNSSGAETLTNAVLDKFVSAGALTVTITPDANTTGTNTYAVKVIINK